MVLAVVCGLILTSVVTTMLLSSLIGMIASIGSSQTGLPKSGVMTIDMEKLIVAEQSTASDPLAMLTAGATTETIGLWTAVQAINAAAADPTVKYIYLKPDAALSDIAVLQELRTSLANFRLSGKPVIAYVETASTSSYYLASVADKIYMTSAEGADTMFVGVGSQLIFIKDLLDKLGVNIQLIRHGKYKSAGEMFVKNAPSEENLEQNQVMIDSIWDALASEIAESRGIAREELDAMIEDLRLNFNTDFLECGLVDALLSREELHEKLADLAVVDKYKDVKMFSIKEYADVKVRPNLKARKKIAVIYANGEIVDGSAKQEVAGDRFASIIAKVRADSTVKAVVLRVNSPGGSVLASDKIKTEIELLKADKPVVASYGAYAASGGYWISNSCDKIYSDATTLTGSIGVFSIIPDFSGTIKDVAHVNIVTVGSSSHSDAYSLMRPLSDVETQYMQASIEHIYDRFVGIVAEGRGLEPDYVDSIGQGRVWTGTDALEIGLVDEIGTLEDAIGWAASIGGNVNVSDWQIVEYPKPLTQVESILSMVGGDSDTEEEVAIFRGTPFEGFAETMYKLSRKWDNRGTGYTFARLPYAIDIR